jgi:hypothetical protein
MVEDFECNQAVEPTSASPCSVAVFYRLPTMHKALLLTLACTCIRVVSPGAKAATTGTTTTAEILRELKSLPQAVGLHASRYHDMHGNANEQLQTLMIRRFEVTRELCEQLDSVSVKTHPAYVASLYEVLATVKDPASIPWLERSLRGPHRKEIYDHWLSGWRAYMRGAAPMESSWLTSTDEWSKFFRAWASFETNETSRLCVLQAMQAWLHDPATEAFFTSMERGGQATEQELLLAQLYLRQHGKPFDGTKLAATIAKLRKSSAGDRILLRYAGSIRHEAFVEWLIDVADEKMEAEFMTPQRALGRSLFSAISQANWLGKTGTRPMGRTGAFGGWKRLLRSLPRWRQPTFLQP